MSNTVISFDLATFLTIQLIECVVISGLIVLGFVMTDKLSSRRK